MQSISLQSHIGNDGILKLQIPVGISNVEVEVLVIMQPLSPPLPAEGPEALGWPAGFIESTAGAWNGEPPIRDPQQEYESREELR